MCTQRPPNNWSEQCYERFCLTHERYLTQTVLPAIQSKHDEFILRELIKRWDNHVMMTRFMKQFFAYLDRFHVKRLNLPTLYEVGMQKFKTCVFDVTKHDNLGAAAIQMITTERHGERIDRTLLKSAIQIFIEMGMGSMDVYTKDFEDMFLKETRMFYSVVAAAWVVEDGTPDYMRKAEQRLEEEEARVENFLHSSTREKLMTVCESELLANTQERLLSKPDTGILALLSQEKHDDLKRMFRLFNRIKDGLVPVAAYVKQHMVSEGTLRVKSFEGKAKDISDFVPTMIAYHDECLKLVGECFEGNVVFHKAMKEAFENFMNLKVGSKTIPELMAMYCDSILKKGVKLSDAVVEENLEKVVLLFNYVTDKDVFAEFYRKMLSKRLLMGRSASDDAEKSIISKLKLRCGAAFTSKLEGMIGDMTSAVGMEQQFNEWLNVQPPIKRPVCDLHVQVLTSGWWPTWKTDELQLPPELLKCVNAFEEFYKSRNDHKKLNWIHNVGLVTISAAFPKKKDLVVSTYQACVLLMLNYQEQITAEDVHHALNISVDEAQKLLVNLSTKVNKMVTSKPPNEGILNVDNGVYTFNNLFQSRQNKIKMPLITLNPVEIKEIQRAVDEDRKHAIEAALVRIMKQRKTLAHNQLMIEVMDQLKQFKPDPKNIKKRIEDLIGREYLQRDPANNSVYQYLA
eukprot:gnl/Spiro4/7827_TR4126_c0_g1_i1.p1 gnl/Spiro4/7827_TR4126_c0_g1~~gnl/Spiro4/7827_TR4126_c0_g1_i1.p1  ORF type:complete len:762 (+),score=280.03 gnl/Spiro4/7827_TR4126_c0_g1_i1:237-2288(+)